MKPSENIINFIKSFEGFSAHAYHDDIDPPNVNTIGYGTIAYPNGESVKLGDQCTEEQAIEYLTFEVNEKAAGVQALIKETPINQNQFDALISFSYNLGINALAESTLLRKLKINPHDNTIYQYKTDPNNGHPIADSCEFVKWCRASGKIVSGLLRRRAAEADIYGTV